MAAMGDGGKMDDDIHAIEQRSPIDLIFEIGQLHPFDPSRSAIPDRLREAARTLWPAAASAELTAEPMKPEEPVTSIRNDIL